MHNVPQRPNQSCYMSPSPWHCFVRMFVRYARPRPRTWLAVERLSGPHGESQDGWSGIGAPWGKGLNQRFVRQPLAHQLVSLVSRCRLEAGSLRISNKDRSQTGIARPGLRCGSAFPTVFDGGSRRVHMISVLPLKIAGAAYREWVPRSSHSHLREARFHVVRELCSCRRPPTCSPALPGLQGKEACIREASWGHGCRQTI